MCTYVYSLFSFEARQCIPNKFVQEAVELTLLIVQTPVLNST